MATGDRPPPNANAAESVEGQLGRRLESWKEIASWFGRSEKTVRRWEQREGMPVHRLQHEKRGTVYAYSGELEGWRQSRKVLALEEVDLAGDVTEDGSVNPDELSDGPGIVGRPIVSHSLDGQDLVELAGAPGKETSGPSDSSSLHAYGNEEARRPRIDSQPANGRPSRRRWWFMLGGLCAALVAVLSWLAWHRNGPHGAVTDEPAIGSVAVLPLTDLAADTSEDYFADGMTEELITELGRLSSIRIISRTSIMQFKKSVRSLPEIARQLNVDALVEGTVRRSGDRVRITARLVSIDPEHLIWQKSYEGDLRDVLMLQSSVAHDIAANIQTKLAQRRVPAALAYKRLDTEAYEDYLRGRYFLAKRTAEAMNTAVDYFQRAVQRDPQFAQAYVGLALAYELLGSYEVLPPDKSYPPAIKFANQALELDDALSEAYTARALAECYYELNWAASDRDFQHAIALDPNSALAHHNYGEYFVGLGNAEHAIAELKIARELDPLSLPLFNALGRMYREAHQYDEAFKQCKQSLVLDPNYSMGHWCLGQVYLAKRQYAQATSELKRANELGTTPLIVCDLGCVYAASGKKTEARAILHSLEDKSQFNYVSPYLIASIYSQLGEKDEAFNWLKKAFDRRDGISYLAADPMMDPLRSDPRFADLIQRLHLPQS